ncbi:hypothetical protein BFL38_05850 [Brachyspira hampsonii]|uniref:Uncharacterized protein n=1 Tax=Brachyspira hampsonii TaxID=1287055 RepID=A0A1E5NDW0_9SPIR|nr:hypothetical protein [Brachyspira hampsonii]OEJ14352.1 hypothetical protein BFL38_05850 [Brachyspira hampsonii]
MKKIIILSTIFIMTSVLAYSHNFVMSLYIPLAGSRPSFYQNGILSEYLTEQAESAFEAGVIFQPSIYFQLNKFHYIVLAVDFGWYRDTFKFHDNYQDFTHEFDSIITGLSLEWKPSIFQIGIGGGVKVPLSGKYWTGDNYTLLDYKTLSSRFNNLVIPYVKLYTGVNFALVSLSFYANFDIPTIQIKNNLASLGEGYKYIGKLASVDIGAQIGVHLPIIEFGKKNDNYYIRNSIDR